MGQKKKTEVTTFGPDTIEVLERQDLVQLSRALLEQVVRTSGALNMTDLSPENMKKLHLVKGFLNANLNAHRVRLQYFRMMDSHDKAAAIKKASKRLKSK